MARVVPEGLKIVPCRRHVVALLAAAAAFGPCRAQGWPDRPVRILVPAPAGGALSRVVDLLSHRLTKRLGQQVYPEYRPGASAVIATAALARAPHDGYTIGIVLGSHAINAVINKKLPYHSLKDFEPVCILGRAPIALVAHAGFPPDDLAGFIDHARRQTEPVQYASLGIASGTHLAAEMLMAHAGIRLAHVPYSGSADVYRDLVTGRIPVGFVTLESAMPQVAAGRIKILALATSARAATHPQYPAIGEHIPGYDASGFFGLMAPAGTPQAIVEALAGHVIAVLHDPEVTSTLTHTGIEVVAAPPLEYAAALRREIERYGELVKRVRLEPQ
jgi:tripartite-type tricarboxylate transporter receptor subunit TctC